VPWVEEDYRRTVGAESRPGRMLPGSQVEIVREVGPGPGPLTFPGERPILCLGESTGDDVS
jgi:hypothetical protein